MSFEHAISPGRRDGTAQVRRVSDLRLALQALLFLSAVVALAFSSAAAQASADDAIDTATVRLQFALGALVGQADPATSENVIGEVLADGADPLTPIEYGFVTANTHRDSFSYLINLAEIAAAREEAGETDHLADDWRGLAWRFHDAMASAADAPGEAAFYLERVVGPARADTDEEASLADRFSRRSNEMTAMFNDATGEGEALAEWQKYERDAYGGASEEIDW